MKNQFDSNNNRRCKNEGILIVLDYYHQYLKNKNCVLYFHFSYLHLSLARNIIVYPLSQSRNREKYFRHQHIKVKKCRLWREINNFSIHLFHRRTRPFHLSTENGRSHSVGDGYQSVYSRADMLLKILVILYSIDGKF